MTTTRNAAASVLIVASLLLPMQFASAQAVQTVPAEYQTLLSLIGRLTSVVAQVAAAAAETNNPEQRKQVTEALSDYVATVSIILQDVVKKMGASQTAAAAVSRGEANELYTLQLKNLLGEIRSANTGDRGTVAKNVGTFAKGRRDFVMSMIYTNAAYVYSTVLSAEDYALLPEDAQMATPKRVTIKGSFERVAVKEKGASVNEYYVTEGSMRYRVHVKGDPTAQTGDTVMVDGALLEDDLATILEKITVTK